MLSTIGLAILLVAALLASVASRLRLSPWWIVLAAAVAAGFALATSSEVATCEARDSTEAVFGFGILFAVGLFATAAFTSLFDAVSLARRGEKSLAAGRLVPLIASVLFGFGTLVLWVATLVSCLS